ncbi:hypothetical protein SCE1572_24140 [Sorangium cellulosum So0157-2]|uniref:Uncharacterized protein n=1 Tax=Sorangium cellulosum So0157-2 TaxID=1254432 RepID=S4XY67_SORCE|nr:hypothetical protein SCE1572_24140 [Sorangium cellulosum So0157-2]
MRAGFVGRDLAETTTPTSPPSSERIDASPRTAHRRLRSRRLGRAPARDEPPSPA